MGCGAAGSLLRHPRWRPTWITLKFRNYLKTAIIRNFLVLDMQNML